MPVLRRVSSVPLLRNETGQPGSGQRSWARLAAGGWQRKCCQPDMARNFVAASLTCRSLLHRFTLRREWLVTTFVLAVGILNLALGYFAAMALAEPPPWAGWRLLWPRPGEGAIADVPTTAPANTLTAVT